MLGCEVFFVEFRICSYGGYQLNCRSKSTATNIKDTAPAAAKSNLRSKPLNKNCPKGDPNAGAKAKNLSESKAIEKSIFGSKSRVDPNAGAKAKNVDVYNTIDDSSDDDDMDAEWKAFKERQLQREILRKNPGTYDVAF